MRDFKVLSKIAWDLKFFLRIKIKFTLDIFDLL